MLTCETCGVNFERADDLVEVTSLRILCPKCAAERAAAKARRAAPSLAAAPAPSAPPMPAARPAQRAAAAAPPAGKPEAKPRPETNAKPAAPAARATPPIEKAPAPALAKSPAAAKPPVGDKAPVDGKASAKPAAKPARKKKIDLDTLESRNLAKRGSREVMIASLAAVIVLVVAGVVVWRVKGKKDAEKDAADARKARIEAFHTEFMAKPMTSDQEANLIITFADENKPLWSEQDFAADVQNRVAKAKTYLQDSERRRTQLQRLEEIEATLAKAAELPPSELAEMRRRLDELAAVAGTSGQEFVARVEKDRQQGEVVYLERLVTSAETAAASTNLDRAALTTLQQSEDEIFKMFNSTALAAQKNSSDQDLKAKSKDLETRYRRMIELSDQSVTKFFTPEVIENTPWRDCLADDQVSAWKGGNDIKGFERRQTGGVMHLIGPDPTEKSDAMISIGDKEVWRDLLIDAEFTIEKGSFTFFFRCPLTWNEKVYSLEMPTTGDGALEAGRTYSFAIRLVASDFTSENKSEDSEPQNAAVSWTIPRKGALAISIPKDTEVKFTRLRVKVLR